MIFIVPQPPKPGDPPPPPFETQVGYAILFALAFVVIIGAAVVLGGLGRV